MDEVRSEAASDLIGRTRDPRVAAGKPGFPRASLVDKCPKVQRSYGHGD
jgi:hypothetical protein